LCFTIKTCYYFVRLIQFQFLSFLFTMLSSNQDTADGVNDAVAVLFAEAAAATADDDAAHVAAVAAATASPVKDQDPVDTALTKKRGSPTPSEECAPDSKKAATSPLKEDETKEQAAAVESTDTPKADEPPSAEEEEDKIDVTGGTPKADNDKPCVITPATTTKTDGEWPTDETKAKEDSADKVDLVVEESVEDCAKVACCVEESVEDTTTVEATIVEAQ
jgi:hypothetical protein